MRRALRTGVVAVLAACALAFAGTASAALNPKFIVVAPPHTGQAVVSLTLDLNRNDASLGKVQVFAPLGYQLNSPKVGTIIGHVKARVILTDRNDMLVPLTGRITAVDRFALATDMQQCTDTASHAAVWMMSLASASSQNFSMNVPIFVDKTTGPEANLSVFKLVMCLPPATVPDGTPGRAAEGARLTFAQFDVNAFANPPAYGEYRWRTLWTPYAAGTADLDTAATVEAQSLVRLPTSVSLRVQKAKVHRKGKTRTLVALSGKLSRAFRGVPIVRVSLQSGKSKQTLTRFKTPVTNRNGDYVKKVYITRPTYFMTEVTTPLRNLGAVGCTASFGPSVPCVSAFIGGQHVLSRIVKVTPFRA